MYTVFAQSSCIAIFIQLTVGTLAMSNLLTLIDTEDVEYIFKCSYITFRNFVCESVINSKIVYY